MMSSCSSSGERRVELDGTREFQKFAVEHPRTNTRIFKLELRLRAEEQSSSVFPAFNRKGNQPASNCVIDGEPFPLIDIIRRPETDVHPLRGWIMR
jgi:hypothetical protein